MEHGIEFYKSYLSFLELVCHEQRLWFSFDDGLSIVGDYWIAIGKDLEKSQIARFYRGNLKIFQLHPLAPIIADCKATIEKVENAESDRELCNRERIENIEYGRKGYRLAKIAIYISVLAIVSQIATAIICSCLWQ